MSDVPFLGPVGGVRVGLVDDEFVVNPTYTEREESPLDLIVVGTENAVTMVECGAKEITEERMLEAIQFGHEAVRELCAMQKELAEQVAEPKIEFTAPETPTETPLDPAPDPVARDSATAKPPASAMMVESSNAVTLIEPPASTPRTMLAVSEVSPLSLI